MILNFNVNDFDITRTADTEIISDSVNYIKCKFTVTGALNIVGGVFSAVFKNSDNISLLVPLDDKMECYLPKLNPFRFMVGLHVCYVNGSGNSVEVSTKNCIVRLSPAAYNNGTNAFNTSEYAELLLKIQQLENDIDGMDVSGKADKTYVDTELAKKSNISHTHSQYLVQSDIADKITETDLGLNPDLDEIIDSGYYKYNDGDFNYKLIVLSGGTGITQIYITNETDEAYVRSGTIENGTVSWNNFETIVTDKHVLTKTNTSSYTPTADYHPATKKYVDDSVVNKESKPTTSTQLPANNTLIVNTEYYLGEQQTLSISFEDLTANDKGKYIYLCFESGSTATNLTVDTSNTTDFDFAPSANSICEIMGKWNGELWLLVSNEMTVTANE